MHGKTNDARIWQKRTNRPKAAPTAESQHFPTVFAALAAIMQVARLFGRKASNPFQLFW